MRSRLFRRGFSAHFYNPLSTSRRSCPPTTFRGARDCGRPTVGPDTHIDPTPPRCLESGRTDVGSQSSGRRRRCTVGTPPRAPDPCHGATDSGRPPYPPLSDDHPPTGVYPSQGLTSSWGHPPSRKRTRRRERAFHRRDDDPRPLGDGGSVQDKRGPTTFNGRPRLVTTQKTVHQGPGPHLMDSVPNRSVTVLSRLGPGPTLDGTPLVRG